MTVDTLEYQLPCQGSMRSLGCHSGSWKHFVQMSGSWPDYK